MAATLPLDAPVVALAASAQCPRWTGRRRSHRLRPLSPPLLLLGLVGILLGPPPPLAAGEIVTFHGIEIRATSSEVHYSKRYLVAPGYVDVSGLAFSSDDDDCGRRGLEAGGDVGTEAAVAWPRREAKSRPPAVSSTVVDVLVFHVPDDCARSKSGCFWPDFGVGAADSAGSMRYCCSEEAARLGFCKASGKGGAEEQQQYGRIIVNDKKYKGERRVLAIPSSGKVEGSHITDGRMTFDHRSGRYVVIIANCNDSARDLTVSGSYEVASKHGFLPGELFGELYFFAAITVVYTLLFVWYFCSMRRYRESFIEVQRWIIISIGLGWLENFFKTGDLVVWNEDGVRVWYAMYTGLILGVVKRAISRTVTIMVCLGWGVIRDDLPQMRKVYALGLAYVIVSLLSDIITVIAVDDMVVMVEEDAVDAELSRTIAELIDVIEWLTLAVSAIDVSYLFWAMEGLNGSIQYLEDMNQNVKLRQYLQLRLIIMFSMLFAFVWAVFGLVNSRMDVPILEDQQEWSVLAAWELNYLLILVGVACLWRPTANAKDYAFVMELPSMEGDGDGSEMVFDTNLVDTIDDDEDLDDDFNDNPLDSNGSSNPLEDDEGFNIDNGYDA